MIICCIIIYKHHHHKVRMVYSPVIPQERHVFILNLDTDSAPMYNTQLINSNDCHAAIPTFSPCFQHFPFDHQACPLLPQSLVCLCTMNARVSMCSSQAESAQMYSLFLSICGENKHTK